MSKWERVSIDLEYKHGKVNHDSKDSEDYRIKTREIALKHPDTGAVVKLSDEGHIDMFAGDSLGFRLDPISNSINFFGNSVNILTKNFNLKTSPDGFGWNGHSFNPELYAKEGSEIMKKQQKNNSYSDGMISLLKDLGLPVETIDKGV